MRVLESLQLGKQSAREMSQNTGLTERAIRTEVRALRSQGYPVCSNDDGYYLSNDIEEIRRCCSRLRAHATAELSIASAMERRAHLLGDAVQLVAL